MKPIKEKAQEFLASGEYSPTLTEAYIQGAKEICQDMFKWNNPQEELPPDGVEVLCMVHRIYQTYGVLKHDARGWWQPFQEEDIEGWCAYEGIPIAWRPIHELK